jgi:hypothetical protein
LNPLGRRDSEAGDPQQLGDSTGRPLNSLLPRKKSKFFE